MFGGDDDGMLLKRERRGRFKAAVRVALLDGTLQWEFSNCRQAGHPVVCYLALQSKYDIGYADLHATVAEDANIE